MKRTFCTIFFIFFFINSVFSQNGSIKSLVEKTNKLNLDIWDFAAFAEENIKDKEQLARFFYYWIGSNIEYDHKSLQEKSDGTITLEEYGNRQDEYEVYTNRKGVCAGYAKLYKWFLNWVDIETVIISGHIRDERNHYVELSEKNFRHAWNAIKLNNEWLLVDSTWGTSNEELQSEFYFDIKPELSIITHYPEDSKWQLLKEPLTLEEFNKSQFVKPIWFIVGFTDVPKLMSDEEYFYFRYRETLDFKWSVGLQFSADNISFKGISDIKVIDQDGLTYYRFGKAQIPEIAFFKVKITKFKNVENGFTIVEYKDVINFKI
jgi:hypothetical protein